MGNSVVTIVKWQDGLAVLPLGRFFPEFYTPPCYTIFVGAQDVTGFCCFPSAWLDFLLIFTSYRLTFPAVARLNLGVFVYLLPSRHPTTLLPPHSLFPDAAHYHWLGWRPVASWPCSVTSRSGASTPRCLQWHCQGKCTQSFKGWKGVTLS